MTEELLINVIPGEIRAALVADGRLIEFSVARRAKTSAVGNVYLGRVERVLPGMEAAFVDIGTGRAGFLNIAGARTGDVMASENINDLITEGEAVTVQVTKDAFGTKGVQLTRRIGLAGRHVVFTPTEEGNALSRQIADAGERDRLGELMDEIAQPGEGFIVRTAAAGMGADKLAADAEFLRGQWLDIEAKRDQSRPPAILYSEIGPLFRALRDGASASVERIVIDQAKAHAEALDFCRRLMPAVAERLELHAGDAPLFEPYGIEAEIDRALGDRVDLPSGGSIVVQSTEALTAIDVNSGSFVDGAKLAETALKINLEAADEIARQIRLRNIGGLIVVDFIRMDEDGHWDRVIAALDHGMAGARTPSRILGRTEAGLVEVTRRRIREPLAETLTEPLGGAGAKIGGTRIKTTATVAFEILRALGSAARRTPAGPMTVIAGDEVIALLEGENHDAFEETAATLGRAVGLEAEPGRGRESFDIVVEGHAPD